jgi:hypothetical protein
MSDDEYETFPNVKCVAETSKAIKAELEDGAQHWIPKSMLSDDSEVYEEGTDGKLIVKSWFCEKEGIE